MICIPVVASTQAEALQFIARSAGLADILEFRMDLLADGDLKGLLTAVRTAAPAVMALVTNRPGAATGAEKERIDVLLEAVYLGADYVDLELETAAAWREKVRALIGAKEERTRLIISHHDFERTPPRRDLIGLFNEAVRSGAQVVKIVTMARSPQDNLTLLGLLQYAGRRNREIVAFCMGEQGKMSRVMAPLLGALFTFGALERGLESAPGQLTVTEMRQIWQAMGGK